jgi:hypothetical protein
VGRVACRLDLGRLLDLGLRALAANRDEMGGRAHAETRSRVVPESKKPRTRTIPQRARLELSQTMFIALTRPQDQQFEREGYGMPLTDTARKTRNKCGS